MSQQTQTTLDIEKIIATRQDPAAPSAAAPKSLDYGEVAVDINGVLRTGNKNNEVVTHVVNTDERLTDTRNPRVTALTNQDLNTITTPGFYYAGGGNTVTNKPSGIAAFGLLVEQTASGYRSQLLIGGDSSPNKMFIRQYTGSSWGAWSSFYTTAYKPSLSELGAAAASHTHTKSQITDFPTSLKNPTSIKIQLNGGTSEGTNQFTYDGSVAKTINITPTSIRAATTLHSHSATQVSGLTANRALISDANGHPAVSAVTSTELGYLDGVTSGIQAQLNGKSPSGHTHPYLPLSGGTMTGSLKLKGDPTESLEAATKAYVDRQIGESGFGDMRKAVYDTDNDGIVDKAEKIESQGRMASLTQSGVSASQDIDIPDTGLVVKEIYSTTTNSPLMFGNILNIKGKTSPGAGQLLLGWQNGNDTERIYYRSHRDNRASSWGPWRKLVYESDLPSFKKIITVNGDSDKYYPVRILNYTNMRMSANPAFFGIFRSYAQKGPDDWNSATHKGALQFISKIYVNGWSGGNSFMEWELAERYAVTFGGIQHSTRGINFIVWLRGGGADYYLMGENPSLNATIYYETTDLTTDFGFSVSPKTYDQITGDYPKFGKGGNAHWKYDGTGVQRNYLENVVLGGAPKAVTPSTSDNSTRIATTAYVKSNLLTDGISTYTHSKSGTVHTLTGSGDNIRFIATADFTSGDTFKIGATSVTAKTIGGDSLWTGFFKNGAVVTCYKNGTTINFNGGGLPASELAKLTPENIKSGIKITANGKTVTGTFTSDGSATAEDILKGKTAYVNGNKITGKIPLVSTEVQAIKSGNEGGRFYFTVPFACYSDEAKVTRPLEEMGAAIGLTAGVLKTGTTVGGVRGTYTSDANAGSGDLRSGKTAYVNGQKITGGLASRDTGTPNPIEYVRLANGRFEVAPPAGIHGCYWDSGLYSYLSYEQVRNVIGLTADKIMSGNTILGIAGTGGTDPSIAATGVSYWGNYYKTIEVNARTNRCFAIAICAGTDYYTEVRVTLRGWNGSSWVEIESQSDYSGTSKTDPQTGMNRWATGYSRYQLEVSNNRDTRGLILGVLVGF